HDLFPVDSNQFTLELLKSVRDIYGANGPEKLLYNVFEKRTAELKAKAKADNVVERAKWLVKVRDSEGYMAQFLPSEKEGPQILECHSDRKSTRLNSSHLVISYAVFCLK